jgi:hypothetical protein
MIFDVSELTSSLLRLKATESETDDFNGDEIPDTMTYSIDLTFSN